MDNTLQSPKEQLIEDINEQIESVEARLRENLNSIEQHQLEVDRLQQRNVSASAELQRVKETFDTIPRDDIQKAYENSLDTQRRMITMRSQLQKLQDTQGYLEELRDSMQAILNALGDVEIRGALGSGGAGDNGKGFELSLAGEQIVRIVEAQEAERKQLANALHDGPAQSLTNFILQAEICQQLFNRNPDMASKELDNLKDAASTSFQKIRDFIFELRPMMLDDLGLIATMRRHTENHNEKHEDIEIEFHLTGAERRLPNHVEVIMFRGLQLLMRNSMDLLQAKHIDIKLDIGDSRILGVVHDNGRHFDTAVELDPTQGDSPLQNLNDLRERVDMIGGQLDIFSEEGKGNQVEILLPFPEDMPVTI